jgi:flagellar biosynthesis protein FlhA
MFASLRLPAWLQGINGKALAAPMLIIIVLAMMVLPLPPFLLDLLFTFNIALAVMVLLTSVNTQKALEFAVFPTVLLVTTLLRLSLNVASSRVVLMEGHGGGAAAGQVIEAFGHFVIGGNYAVGIVVFVILTVINFVVITKGAGRIAEVSARFTLDAMPGKQMAIDADLNAGLIGEEDARRRRSEVTQEAEFYGSMDGASKFVRGDAIAGVLIILINLIGGLIVGMAQHSLSFAEAAKNYTLLTIGDGLVAQLPALVISTAAGIIVSRVGTGESIGQQLVKQLFAKPQALIVTAAILGVLGLIPGMPNLVFVILAAVLGGTAYWMTQRAKQVVAVEQKPAEEVLESHEASWKDVALLDALGLEVGYRLIPLVDQTQDGELLRKIKGIRKKFAQEIGFLPPAVHIRDNLELKPNEYRIKLKGVEIGSGAAYAGMLMAINPAGENTLPGTPTKDPAFGLPATWIEASLREHALGLGYTVVDASTVIATHLNHVVQTHAAELLGRQEVQALLDHLNREAPKLTEDIVPKLVPLATLQKVLQNLLEESVHIRDMHTILDRLAEHAPRTQDPQELAAHIRVALGRAIAQDVFPNGQDVSVISLEPQLEKLLLQALQSGEDSALEPGLADALAREANAAVQRQEALGIAPVLLAPTALRVTLSRFLRRALPQLRVLAHAEIPNTRTIRVSALLGGRA